MSNTMTWDDVSDAIGMHKNGLLPYRAAAWALMRFRGQWEIPLTLGDLQEHVGGSKATAYRTIAELKQYQQSPISRVAEIDSRRVSESENLSRRHQDSLVLDPGTTPLREMNRGIGVGEGDEGGAEPFHCEPSIPAHPLPPGRLSKEATALKAKYGHYGKTDDGTNYGDLAATLCDSTRADWIDLYFEHQLAIWNRRPGFGAAAKAMKRWRDDGKPGWRYTQQTTEEPPPALRATGTTGPAPRQPSTRSALDDALDAMENDA